MAQRGELGDQEAVKGRELLQGLKREKGEGLNSIENVNKGGAWVGQSVERLTSAQVMISRFVSSNLASGSVLTAQSLDPVSDSVSPSLPDPPPSVSLCFKNK